MATSRFRVGTHSHGQGHETTLAQVAHEILGVDLDRIKVLQGDTLYSPFSTGTWASRSIVMAGGAVAQASRTLAGRASRIGAWLLQADPADVRTANGSVIGRGRERHAARGRPRLVSAASESAAPTSIKGGLEVTTGYRPARDTGTFSYATHAAMVAVDPGTGLVEILDYVVVEDGGKLVNPMIVDGQVQGGTAQGIGTCLLEAVPFDAQGQPLASTMLDYLLPGANRRSRHPGVAHGDALPAHRIRHEGDRRGRRGGPAGSDRFGSQRRPASARRRSARSAAHARTNPRRYFRCDSTRRSARTMKPANFEFARAATLAEAAAILRQADGAKVVAGGQSLGPMLNLRLVQPSILVDITAIPELTRIEEDADWLSLGACITTSDIEDGRVPVAELPILMTVAGGVAYRAVRNRGTVGGSICHADPAGDWLPALLALRAECVISDGRRARRVPIEQFVIGAFEVMLETGELLQAIRIPRPSRNARCGYYKVCRKAGEFALATGALLLDPDRGLIRAVIGATRGRPIVIDDARSIFDEIPRPGNAVRLDENAVTDLLAHAGLTRPADVRLHITALSRAAAQAMAK